MKQPQYFSGGVSFPFLATAVDGVPLTEAVEYWISRPYERLKISLRDRLKIAGEEQPGYVCLTPLKPDECFDPRKSDYTSLLRVDGIELMEKPNQALEPATPAVTDRADARSAPAVVMAHL